MISDDAKLALIAEALKSLPEQNRLIVSLYYYEELSSTDIAKLLFIPEDEVVTFLNEFRQTIKERINAVPT